VASAGPYASLHLAPDKITSQYPTTLFFTGRMPFLLPNQQRQSTEGTTRATKKWSKKRLEKCAVISACTPMPLDYSNPNPSIDCLTLRWMHTEGQPSTISLLTAELIAQAIVLLDYRQINSQTQMKTLIMPVTDQLDKHACTHTHTHMQCSVQCCNTVSWVTERLSTL